MDQKHAMLFGELQPNSRVTQDQRALASSAIGLPTEHHGEPPPPSYDFAVASSTDPVGNENWYSNSTFHAAISPNIGPPDVLPPSNFARNDISTRSFIEPISPYQPNPSTVHVINQTHISKLGPHPCTVFCPSCGTSRSTRMVYSPNTRTHFCALILCLVGWCCCACLIPYCTNNCRTGSHYCTACNTFLGVYNPQDNTVA